MEKAASKHKLDNLCRFRRLRMPKALRKDDEVQRDRGGKCAIDLKQLFQSTVILQYILNVLTSSIKYNITID